MAQYTRPQLAQAAHNAGFRGIDLVFAVAISLAENPARDPNAVHHNSNGTVDRGAWQINSVHNFSGNPFDLQTNANQAYKVYHDAGSKFTPWATYNSGKYKLYEKTAGNVSIKVDPHIAQETVGLGHNWTDNIAQGSQNAVDGAGNVVKGAVNAADAIPALVGHILSPGFWRAVGIGALALLLVIFGFILMTESNKTVRQATEAAAIA